MNNFITTALPYANGDLHWGHFFEAVIADIYSKHKKIPLISGDDQHGAAITLFVEKNNLNITQHLENQYLSHKQQYQYLGVDFSYFGKTHSDIHSRLVIHLYNKLKDKGLIIKKKTISWFDIEKEQFLPDRYVRGQCPSCLHENVYPHVCEYCNYYFEASELVNPISSLSQSTPALKETEHFFLNTQSFYQHLISFCDTLNIHDSIRKKILDKSLQELNEIDITRDIPYFGIEIPDNKLAFYVWFDAPIGYLSFILEYLSKNNPQLSFEDLLSFISNLKIEHIIGKDITYFHTFFWLNLLRTLDIPLPKKLHVHGWITQENGEKYSKSQGDKLDLSVFSPEQIDSIRFYFASIYDKSIQDNLFSIQKSYETYNLFIVGKFINIYSRISKLLENKGIKEVLLKEKSIFTYQVDIDIHLKEFHLKNTIKDLFLWIDQVNIYIQEQQPWKIIEHNHFIEVCSTALSEFKLISYYIGIICCNLKKQLDLIDYNNIKHIHLSSKISS